MDDPVRDIGPAIHTLVSGSPKDQQQAIETYFTPNACFVHPFCRTGSFNGSRNLILAIYRWYKIMSPRIDVKINSIAFDETNLILYVNLSQTFAIWFVPFHRSPVTLTTMLHLSHPPNSRKYYITEQNDLYQVDQFVKFFAPWGVGSSIVIIWNLIATAFCVVFAFLGSPQTWFEQKWYDARQKEKPDGEASRLVDYVAEKVDQNQKIVPYFDRFTTGQESAGGGGTFRR